MDSRAVVDAAGGCNGENGLDAKEEDSVTEALLPPPLSPPPAKRGGGGGVMKGKRTRSFVRRKVQWNDRNGDKLVHVLEFQPSDSSDSEDEYGDSCICAIM